jgi:hypothetical protein
MRGGNEEHHCHHIRLIKEGFIKEGLVQDVRGGRGVRRNEKKGNAPPPCSPPFSELFPFFSFLWCQEWEKEGGMMGRGGCMGRGGREGEREREGRGGAEETLLCFVPLSLFLSLAPPPAFLRKKQNTWTSFSAAFPMAEPMM